jgi:hypothetical protein
MNASFQIFPNSSFTYHSVILRNIVLVAEKGSLNKLQLNPLNNQMSLTCCQNVVNILMPHFDMSGIEDYESVELYLHPPKILLSCISD